MEITKKQRNFQNESDASETRFWSELPIDILIEIFKNIYLVDRIFFRAVCKNWNLVPTNLDDALMPLLMSYDAYNITKMSEFAVMCRNPPTICTVWGPDLDEYKSMRVLSTGKGWLLLRDGNTLQNNKKLVFFSPFKKKIIKLPVPGPLNYVATFSGTPDEPSDCIVFVVESYSYIEFNIRTCRCSESAWMKYSFSIPVRSHTCDVLYKEPMLYCVSSDCILSAFNSFNNKLSILSEWLPRDISISSSMCYTINLVQSDNDELMMVYRGNILSRVADHFMVFRFDFSEKVWERKIHLGSQVIYLQDLFPRPRRTAFAVTVEGEAKHLANKIYYHDRNMSWYFCLETRRCTELSCDEPVRTPKNEKKRFEVRYSPKLWIQPPNIF